MSCVHILSTYEYIIFCVGYLGRLKARPLFEFEDFVLALLFH